MIGSVFGDGDPKLLTKHYEALLVVASHSSSHLTALDFPVLRAGACKGGRVLLWCG